MSSVVDKKRTAEDIRSNIKISRGGDIYEYLSDLEQAGFITKDLAWSLKDGKMSKRSLVRLSDNYSRFYLKYILPNKMKIDSDLMAESSLSALPGWNSIMGLQIENLILNNKKLIHQALDLSADEIICAGPYYQTKTKTREGCQIDYLILTKFNVLYICEIKFSKNEIRKSIISEVQRKIDALKIPRHYSYRPVLIHCNEVSDLVEESGFFASLIDFSKLFHVSS